MFVEETGVAEERMDRSLKQRPQWLGQNTKTLFRDSDIMSAEGFLNLLDGQTVGLIVWLIVPVVVALKSKQLIPVSFSDHLEVDAPLHPGF